MMSKRFILISIIFVLVTIIFTFPLVLRINSCIAGWHSTDEPYAALWNFWWLKYAHAHHINDAYYSTIAAPFGMNGKSGYLVWNFINKWFSIVTNNIIAYNMEVFFSFFASAVLMYFLVFYLTKNTVAGIISAIIYTLSPYHFVRIWQHLGLAQIQWLPLYLLSFLVLRNNPDLLNSICVALALFLVMSFDFYYAYFMVIVTVVFILFIILYKWKTKIKSSSQWFYDGLILKMLLIALVLSIFITLPYTYPIFIDRLNYAGKASGVFNPFLRPFEDLFSQSARPLSYFLPAPSHPFFGKFTESFVGTSLYGESFTEHVLFLGWTPLVLAFIAFRRWKFKRKEINKTGTVPFGDSPCCREDFYIGFFVFLAIVAWLFSQPPWWKIGPVKFYMPSFFMYRILPMFRAYCRFGIVVMLAVAVLAGLGLKFILEKFKRQKTKFIITTLFCGLVLFEFWNYPPFKVIDVSRVPAVYYWLGEQSPDITIAEYPLDTNGPNELYKFYQTKHERKIINGTIPGTSAHRLALNITRLSDPDTAGILKWMGVKYALVHQDGYLQTDLIEEREELNKIPKNSGLVFIKSFPAGECPQKDIMCVQKTGPIDVYEVMAQPIEPKIEAK